MNWLMMLAAGAGIGGAFLLIFSRGSTARRIGERVAVMQRKSIARPNAARRDPHAFVVRFGPFAMLQTWLLLADLKPQRRHIVLVLAGLAAVVVAVEIFVGIEAAAGAALISVVAGVKLLQVAARMNAARFRTHLPNFLERMRTILASGSSLMVSFDRALEYAHPTVRAYLLPVSTRMALGASFPDSLRHQAERLDNSEIELLAMIAQANLRYGGTLSDVLDRLVKTLRGQNQVKKEFAALTSETRSSAGVLFALPLVVGGVIFVSNPSYVEFFVNDPTGQKLLGYAVASNILGVLALKRLSNLEV